jgi:hypothetical protein
MSVAKVEDLMNHMGEYYLDLHSLTRMLAEVLDDAVVTGTGAATQVDTHDTAEVYGSEAQIALMRRVLEEAGKVA